LCHLSSLNIIAKEFTQTGKNQPKSWEESRHFGVLPFKSLRIDGHDFLDVLPFLMAKDLSGVTQKTGWYSVPHPKRQNPMIQVSAMLKQQNQQIKFVKVVEIKTKHHMHNK